MIPISEYAKKTSIPKLILRYLHREGIIQDPLCERDRLCLDFLEQIWGRRDILRAQLSRLSQKARFSFLRTADLPTKWERYASSRYFKSRTWSKAQDGYAHRRNPDDILFSAHQTTDKPPLQNTKPSSAGKTSQQKTNRELAETVSYIAQTNK